LWQDAYLAAFARPENFLGGNVMKVFVTGSTGLIGKVVVQRLLEAGHTLRASDLTAQPQTDDYEYIPGDTRDSVFIRRAVQGMDAVVHLAAIPYDVDRQDELILDTNLRGTWNVLLSAQEAGVGRIVFFSSINALGQAEPDHPGLYLPLDDDIPHYNIRNYSLTKHLGEEMCRAFARRGVLTAVSLRPTHVTNPGPPRFPWFRNLPQEFRIRSAVNDFFSYVDVRDVAQAALLSLTAEVDVHQAFLLASPESSLRIPTTEVVEKYYPHLPWPRVSKEEHLTRGEYVSLLDCSAARQVLDWQPQFSQFNPEDGYEV
jgi:UDP-glucose 4-epimerase